MVGFRQIAGDDLVDDLCIQKSALEKLLTMAAIMDDQEFTCVLVGDPATGIIEDTYLPDQQHINESAVTLDGWTILAYEDDLKKKGLVGLGIAHSHGHHPVFFSQQDHTAFDVQLDRFRQWTVHEDWQEVPLVSRGPLAQVRLTEERTLRVLESPLAWKLSFPQEHFSDDEVRKIAREAQLSYLASRSVDVLGLVVNACGDLYAVRRKEIVHPFLAAKDFWNATDSCSGDACDKEQIKKITGGARYTCRVPIRCIADEVISVDEGALREELEQKILGKKKRRGSIFDHHASVLEDDLIQERQPSYHEVYGETATATLLEYYHAAADDAHTVIALSNAAFWIDKASTERKEESLQVLGKQITTRLEEKKESVLPLVEKIYDQYHERSPTVSFSDLEVACKDLEWTRNTAVAMNSALWQDIQILLAAYRAAYQKVRRQEEQHVEI
jgi:hypothetical protein